MCITYNDVLKRLKEERCRLDWTQEDMGRHIRMDQSNYSKVELGLRRLSYYELECLNETEVDIYYVYTEQRSSGQYTDFFHECTYPELLCFLNVLYAVAWMRYREEPTEKWRKLCEKLEYITLIGKETHSDNIFMTLRRLTGWQQEKMAKKLGMDVKTLRNLEKGRKQPDSEILGRMYEVFYISPAVMLKDKKGVESEIAVFLEQLEEEDKKQIFELFTMLHHMSNRK